MASDWVDRGVDVNSDDEMISLPGELLRQISNYPGVQSPRDSLFREDDPVEGLLGISPHEKEQLQEAWQASRKKIEALEVRSLRTEQLDDGSVKLEVPDLAQSLSAMAMDFELAIEQALGESRARTFSVLKRLDETFSLQAGVRHYHLRVESVGNGSWRYHIESSDQQGSRVWVGDSVPQKIRHLTDAAQIVPSIRAADSGESE